MEKKPSVFMVSMGYGMIISLAIVVYSLILYLVGMDQNPWLMYLSYVILLIGIILAQINYKNKYLGGYMEYGKAFQVGMLASLFVGVVTAVYTYVFFTYIDPGAMEEIMVKAEQDMIDRGSSDMEVEQGMAFLEKLQTPVMYAFLAFLGNFLIGTILSLITSIFVKKEGQGIDQPQV